MIYQPIRDPGGRVSGIFVQGYDVTETHILAKKVAHDAAHDSVTGLLNRREFERRWDALKSLAGPHAILYIDVDHFRTIKKRLGRAAGDEVLQQVAAILQQHLKETDLLATVGGDQFAAALPGTSTKDALELTHNLCLAVRETQFAWGDKQFSVTLSIGLAEFQSLGTISFTDALGIADAACSLAKEKGRDRVYVYDRADLLTAD